MSLIDSHCHLDNERFDSDRDETIDRALAAGVTRMLSIGTGEGLPDLEAGIRMAEKYDVVYASAGIHPEFAPKYIGEDLKRLDAVVRHRKCVLIGEIGLDYYWKPFDKNRQAALFVDQMNIAREAGKPISIHTRDAWDDTVDLLRRHWAPTGLPCIMHCFTGNPDQAQQALDLGFYLSFAGVVTYPKAVELHESARMVPLHRLLVETDSPYLAPVPHRGKRNEPGYVVHTARKLADLRGEDPAVIERAVTVNFETLIASH